RCDEASAIINTATPIVTVVNYGRVTQLPDKLSRKIRSTQPSQAYNSRAPNGMPSIRDDVDREGDPPTGALCPQSWLARPVEQLPLGGVIASIDLKLPMDFKQSERIKVFEGSVPWLIGQGRDRP